MSEAVVRVKWHLPPRREARETSLLVLPQVPEDGRWVMAAAAGAGAVAVAAAVFVAEAVAALVPPLRPPPRC